MRSFAEKLHISTIDERAHELALEHGLGIECAEFCWAQYIDSERAEHIEKALRDVEGIESRWFHAPFAEISPCAIDPRVRELTKERYRQSIGVAAELGIRRIVIHGGYIPYVYFPESYVEGSVRFWREFLLEIPKDVTIALENVMEPDPAMLVEIAKRVNDKRLGLCLDIGHANCETSGLPPLEWIEPMSPYLKHLHLHDNTGGRDLHLPLGEGSIPVECILKRAEGLCPEATFTIENMRSAGSIEWLREKGFLDDR